MIRFTAGGALGQLAISFSVRPQPWQMPASTLQI
jgi:hypothetical protein